MNPTIQIEELKHEWEKLEYEKARLEGYKLGWDDAFDKIKKILEIREVIKNDSALQNS